MIWISSRVVKISKNNQAIAIGERTNKLFEMKFRDDRTHIDQKVIILSIMITQVSLEVLYRKQVRQNYARVKHALAKHDCKDCAIEKAHI